LGLGEKTHLASLSLFFFLNGWATLCLKEKKYDDMSFTSTASTTSRNWKVDLNLFAQKKNSFNHFST